MTHGSMTHGSMTHGRNQHTCQQQRHTTHASHTPTHSNKQKARRKTQHTNCFSCSITYILLDDLEKIHTSTGCRRFIGSDRASRETPPGTRVARVSKKKDCVRLPGKLLGPTHKNSMRNTLVRPRKKKLKNGGAFLCRLNKWGRVARPQEGDRRKEE